VPPRVAEWCIKGGNKLIVGLRNRCQHRRCNSGLFRRHVSILIRSRATSSRGLGRPIPQPCR
jgi:hypothetical protein